MAEFVGIVLFLGSVAMFIIWNARPPVLSDRPLTDAEKLMVAVKEMRFSREKLYLLEMESMAAWERSCDCPEPREDPYFGKKIDQEWVPTHRAELVDAYFRGQLAEAQLRAMQGKTFGVTPVADWHLQGYLDSLGSPGSDAEDRVFRPSIYNALRCKGEERCQA